MRMQYNYKALLKRSLSYIIESIQNGLTVRKFSEGYRAIINRLSMLELTKQERLRIFYAGLTIFKQARYHYQKDGDNKQAFTVLTRRTKYDILLRACRQAAAYRDIRTKLNNLDRAVENGFIFFICSEHPNCGEDHIKYQGQIFIDEAWRTHVKGEYYNAVLALVHNRNIQTFQSVLYKPVWLCTRPYCKHYLIPIDTATVLNTGSLNILRRKYAKMHKPIYADYEYEAFRKEVYHSLYKQFGIAEFNI